MMFKYFLPGKLILLCLAFDKRMIRKGLLKNDLPFSVLLISACSGTELPFGIRKVRFH